MSEIVVVVDIPHEETPCNNKDKKDVVMNDDDDDETGDDSSYSYKEEEDDDETQDNCLAITNNDDKSHSSSEASWQNVSMHEMTKKLAVAASESAAGAFKSDNDDNNDEAEEKELDEDYDILNSRGHRLQACRFCTHLCATSLVVCPACEAPLQALPVDVDTQNALHLQLKHQRDVLNMEKEEQQQQAMTNQAHLTEQWRKKKERDDSYMAAVQAQHATAKMPTGNSSSNSCTNTRPLATTATPPRSASVKVSRPSLKERIQKVFDQLYLDQCEIMDDLWPDNFSLEGYPHVSVVFCLVMDTELKRVERTGAWESECICQDFSVLAQQVPRCHNPKGGVVCVLAIPSSSNTDPIIPIAQMSLMFAYHYGSDRIKTRAAATIEEYYWKSRQTTTNPGVVATELAECHI